MVNLKVRITFTDDVLGMTASDPSIYDEYIGSQAPNPELALEEHDRIPIDDDTRDSKGMTRFPRSDSGEPILYDYQVRGFFKEACGALKRVPGSACSQVRAHKKEVDLLLFANPRDIILHTTSDIEKCSRPLRASTPQGERVAIACSEAVAEGTWAEFELTMLKDDMETWVRECLDYGCLHGMGQWRNSGKGRFIWEEIGRDAQSFGGGEAAETPAPKKRGRKPKKAAEEEE